MAQNISVTLVLDDRNYTTKLRTAEAVTQSFAKSSETSALAASSAFNKLGTTTDFLVKRFGGLRTALAGLGFAAVGGSALAMADDLDDLSKASGFSIGQLIEFKKALAESGGEAEQMSTALNNFLRSIDEAAEGNLKAQKSFRSLNVSINDLRTLSEQDLFFKTLEGIAGVTDKSRQAALMMDKFGKSFKTVDPRELLDQLRATRGEGDKYAETIRRAAELNNALVQAQGTLKLAFLEAFSPVINIINEFNTKTDQGRNNMEKLVVAIKTVASVLVAAFSVSIILPTVAAIGTLLRGISAIGVALGGAALPAWLIASSGAAAKFLPILRAIGLLFAGGLGIYTASKLFDNLGDIAANAFARIIEGIGEVAGQFLNIPTDLIGKMLGIDNPVGLGSGLLKLVENARRAREAFEQQNARKPEVLTPERARPGGPTNRPVTDVEGEKELARQRKLKEALNDQRVTYQQLEDSQRTFTNYLRGDLQYQTDRLRLSEDQLEIQDALTRETERYLDQRNALSEKLGQIQAKITFEERNQYGLKEDDLKASKDKIELLSDEAQRIQGLFELYYNLHIENGRNIERELGAQQRYKNAEKERAALIEYNTQLIEQQYSSVLNLEEALVRINDQRIEIRAEREQQGLTQLKREFYQIEESARRAALEAGRAFAATFDTGGDGLTPERAQQLADGLAQIAQGYRAIADAQAANLQAAQTFEAGWRTAFESFYENATNAAKIAEQGFGAVFNNIFSALDRFVETGKFSFKDFARSIIQDLIKIELKANAMQIARGLGLGGGGGNFLSTIGNFFSGLFGGANGGPLDTSPLIVGERGPELFIPRSAGQLIANNRLGGSQPTVNNTYVTNNISAIDAKGVAQLFYENRQTLFGTVEQAKKELPFRQGAMA